MTKQDKHFLIVQLVLMNETGDSNYRMRWPAETLSRQAPAWTIVNLDARAKERFQLAEDADLLVLFQSHDLDLVPVIHRRRAAGKKTLVEYNDNFYAPPAATPVAADWSSPILWESYERLMREGDGTLVTGPGLEQLFAPLGKPLHILENHLPHQPKAFADLWPESGNEIRIGLAGSLGHMSDYLAVAPILKRVLAQFPQVVLHVMGNESLPTVLGIPPERLRFTPWGSMSQYFDFLEPLHLVLAPLLPTPYNLCRSDIKAVEIAGSGALPLLPKLLPYEKFIAETGLPTYTSFFELEQLLMDRLRNGAELKALAEKCHSYVASTRVADTQTERRELYELHLPEQPSSSSLSAGYHEIEGTPVDHTRENQALKLAQIAIGRNDTESALQTIESEFAANPVYPGLALARLKLLSRTLERSHWLNDLANYANKFPRDRRFLLLRIQAESDPAEKESCWNKLCAQLEQDPHRAREFYENQVVSVFQMQQKDVGFAVRIGERLKSMYPHSASLHFILAEAYERAGDFVRASEYCRWLSDWKEAGERNKILFDAYDRIYLRTWLESLEHRHQK